jgi:hypothetical protein
MMRGVTLATAVAVLAVTPASVHAAPLSELAAEAVRDLCPDLLEIETPLVEVESIKARGYLWVATRNHPRAGTLDVVQLAADDGTIWIANSRDASMCQVGLEGNAARAAFEALVAGANEIDPTFVTDNAAALPVAGLRMTSLRTPAIDGVYLGIQFIDAAALKPDGPLIVQQYLLEE